MHLRSGSAVVMQQIFVCSTHRAPRADEPTGRLASCRRQRVDRSATAPPQSLARSPLACATSRCAELAVAALPTQASALRGSPRTPTVVAPPRRSARALRRPPRGRGLTKPNVETVNLLPLKSSVVSKGRSVICLPQSRSRNAAKEGRFNAARSRWRRPLDAPPIVRAAMGAARNEAPRRRTHRHPGEWRAARPAGESWGVAAAAGGCRAQSDSCTAS